MQESVCPNPASEWALPRRKMRPSVTSFANYANRGLASQSVCEQFPAQTAPPHLTARKSYSQCAVMRPLKPYVLAVSGFIAAVFGALFLGTPVVPQPAATPSSAPHPDLQAAKRLAPGSDLSASRDSKAVRKIPAPQPVFPAALFSFADDFHAELPRRFDAQPRFAVRERLIDRRQRLLVGVVELRI